MNANERAANDPGVLERLRWRARRGLLENDLLLKPFLENELATLTGDGLTAFDRLLQLSDNDLLDVLMGRVAPVDATLVPLIARIRAASAN